MKDIKYTITKVDSVNSISSEVYSVSRYETLRLYAIASGFTSDITVKATLALTYNTSTLTSASYNLSPVLGETNTFELYINDIVLDNMVNGVAYTAVATFSVYDEDDIINNTVASEPFSIYKTNVDGVNTTDMDRVYIELNKLSARLTEIEGE